MLDKGLCLKSDHYISDWNIVQVTFMGGVCLVILICQLNNEILALIKSFDIPSSSLVSSQNVQSIKVGGDNTWIFVSLSSLQTTALHPITGCSSPVHSLSRAYVMIQADVGFSNLVIRDFLSKLSDINHTYIGT